MERVNEAKHYEYQCNILSGKLIITIYQRHIYVLGYPQSPICAWNLIFIDSQALGRAHRGDI